MSTPPTESLTVEAALAERFALISRQLRLRTETAAIFAEWQQELRGRLRSITGIDTMQTCPLDPQLDPPVALDGYRRQRLTIAVEPGVRMALYILLPDNLQDGEQRAAIIAPHGHGGGGKESVAGRDDLAYVVPAIRQYNYDYGVQFVRAGFIVFCPDARGFGERRERTMLEDQDPLGGSCRVINNMAMPLGQTITGMWTWDLMRLIDYIETRSDCDSARIGCAGLSGGGLQTLWLSALDQRVRCAIVSGYFYGYKDSLLHLNQNCSCNYVPGLWQLADIGDIGALIAPRPLLIESGTRDPLNGERGLQNVDEQLAITRPAYQLLAAGQALEHTTFEGEHRWGGADAVAWLRRWLR